MLLIHGSYHFWPKRVGFRNDYCLSCRAERRSVAMRTFDVGHVYWIPILPVGFWKHWQCGTCGKEPHTSPSTRTSFKWAGLVLLILFSGMSWFASARPADGFDWAFRIGGPIAAGLLLWHLLRSPKGVSLRKALKSVVPANDMTCPFCQTPLLAGPRWTCPGCGVARY